MCIRDSKYISPIETRKLIKSFVIISDFGLVILIKKEFFIKEENWHGVKVISEDEAEEKEEINCPKLPYKREYYVVPYTLIDDIELDMAEQMFKISTKVKI